MNGSFDFDEVDQFLCGTVGSPGHRTFYLQALVGSQVVTLKLEKQQVALLAEYLNRLLAAHDLPAGPAIQLGDLLQPAVPEWSVGSLLVAVNEATGRIVVIAQQLGDEPDDDDEGEEGVDSVDRAELRMALTRAQVEAFIDAAHELMAGGRPACRLCGRPVDPEGHTCPRWN
ncbi:MAG: DUF3090 family protein [Microthrixaceae bacterium]|nr:DUF3090 family protein [Microthrixaceae bacterium]